MCGRFALTASGEELAEEFELESAPSLSPRFNIAPSQQVLVVRTPKNGRREAAWLAWGFATAAGAKGRLVVNARAETAFRLPSFRDSFRTRRCLVPASGFFEWQASARPRQPFYLQHREGKLLALAGLWQPGPAGAPDVCLILTTEPNSLVRPIHDRMPVIVSLSDRARWLTPEMPDHAMLRSLWVPFAAERMTSRPVSTVVNDARHDSASCLEPARTLFG